MNSRALKVLEFDKIVKLLAACAQSDSGKACCLALEPSSSLEDIRLLQQETEEAVITITYIGQNPMQAFSDVSDYVHLAEKGATCSPGVLLSIASLLRCAESVRQTLVTDRENTPLITSMASLLQPLHSLSEEITSAIISQDEISDHASQELADIRRHIRICNERIKDKLTQMTHGSAYAKYLMEPIVTIRNNRYVLPVKQEYRQQVPGLVHDQSATGATLYIEPMAVVDLGNDLKEWHAKERNEIERILAALSARVSGSAAQILSNIELLTRLDFIFAKGEYARNLHAVEPKMNTEGRIRLNRARHPLIPPDAVVPSTLWLGDLFTTLVITGPNTGGKTVTLKTIGLFCLMAQAGLHIPADLGSELAVFHEIYADIGDEQSIEQSLSTFSSHMTNIVAIMREVQENDLVLFDELGAGTDPTEGAALAQAILESLTKRGIRAAATTHYSELKSYALTSRNVENASVEFDVSTLRPTYRLSIGIPGKSNAFEISRRLGLSEDLIADAKELLSRENIRFEDVIANAEYHRQVAEKERQLAEEAHAETVRLKNEAEELYKTVQATRQNADKKAREEARRIVEKARREAEQILSDMRTVKKNADSVTEAGKLKRKLDRSLDLFSDGISPEDASMSAPPETVHEGDTVEILTLHTQGTVLSPPDAKADVLVQAGSMKMKTPLAQLRLKASAPEKKAKSAVNASKGIRIVSVPLSCDLRGMNLEEAIDAADRYLDEAYLAGLHEVTLVHGKGTGILRTGIQQHLKKHAHVKSYRLGMYGEGEDGVTIVMLK